MGTPTNVKVSQVPTQCDKLRQKILKKYAGTFKEKLGKEDRVKIPPVKLHLKDTDVRPINVGKCFDIPIHLREPAKKEFVEMIDAGILVPHDKPAEWRSQSFPRAKPGSDPVKVRWVTDFRRLNACLARPVWGAESSSQILRNLPPEAKYFASFDATSGFHQIRVDEASSKMMTIVTIYGTYRFTVLGQGICPP